MLLHILIAIAIFYLLPNQGAALQWERASGFDLTWWTGHYVHWSPGHLFWDCLMFATFGLLAAKLYRLRLHLTFLITAPLLTLGTSWLLPEVGTYRGLSGFDTVLFTFVSLRLLLDSISTREHTNTALAAAMLLGLTGKTLYEVFTGQPLFAQDLGPDVVPLPEVHLIGAFLGTTIAALSILRENAHPPHSAADTQDACPYSAHTLPACGCRAHPPHSAANTQDACPYSAHTLPACDYRRLPPHSHRRHAR